MLDFHQGTSSRVRKQKKRPAQDLSCFCLELVSVSCTNGLDFFSGGHTSPSPWRGSSFEKVLLLAVVEGRFFFCLGLSPRLVSRTLASSAFGSFCLFCPELFHAQGGFQLLACVDEGFSSFCNACAEKCKPKAVFFLGLVPIAGRKPRLVSRLWCVKLEVLYAEGLTYL